MKVALIGIGAAGNKCVFQALQDDVVGIDDVVLVNSTSKDFPEEYNGKKIIISPRNTGAGKEREVAKVYIHNAIKDKEFEGLDALSSATAVCIVASVEGGTGSGSAPLLAQYMTQVMNKNTHIFALTGFEEDVRGIANTIEFFKELESNIIVHTISNAAFLEEANNNKSKAEELANKEFQKIFNVISGKMLIPSDQNIDDTDIIKLSNTYGYSIIGYKELEIPFSDSYDYDKFVKRIIYSNKSIKTDSRSASKLGVILNLKEESREVLTDIFAVLKEVYGTAYELFKHIQYDGGKEYVAYIASGMKLPIEEMRKVYDNYYMMSKTIDKSSDTFFDEMKEMELLDEDKKFDMIQPVKKGISTEEFLSKF